MPQNDIFQLNFALSLQDGAPTRSSRSCESADKQTPPSASRWKSFRLDVYPSPVSRLLPRLSGSETAPVMRTHFAVSLFFNATVHSGVMIVSRYNEA